MSTLFYLLFLSSIISPFAVICCGDSYQTDISRGRYSSSPSSRYRRDVSDIPPRKFCSPNASVPPTRTDTTTRLKNLREKLSQLGLLAYLIPSTDAHQSEYVAGDDKRRAWISGFTGSNGFAVVTTSSAAAWLDGRYYIQGEEQLDCNWILMRSDEPETPDWWDWLTEEVIKNGTTTVGADPALTGAATWLDWKEKLAMKNISLKPIEDNLVDLLWEKVDEKKTSQVDVCREEYAGLSWKEKIKDLLDDLKKKEASAMVVTALDEIAWLFNIRGEAIPYSPVVKAYALVTQNSIYLYLSGEVSRALMAHLNSGGCEGSLNCVIIREYDQVFKDLSGEAGNNVEGKILLGKPWAYTGGASFAIYNAVEESKRLLELSPIMLKKAQKNEVEVQGMENANIKDAVALIAFCAELENGIAAGEEWDELKASERLLEFRSEQNLFKGPSFQTIAAYGANGAIIHYKPSLETNTKIGTDALFLLDSGAQYLDGTTDVTRTFHFGDPTPFEKEAYTRVLMGAVDLARGIFRAGTTDTRMDILARSPLYSVGLNYRHGTGHGIGAYGLVHESPIQVRIYKEEEHELKVGMFFSDEPGVYIENMFGVRLETVLRVVEKNLTYAGKGFGPFYGFKAVCLVPFEPKLIDYSLLSREQVDWLNQYNKNILDKVGPILLQEGYTSAYSWLVVRTNHITREQDSPRVPRVERMASGSVATTFASIVCFASSIVHFLYLL
eukprot:GFUD01016088.1.p1 GENE.GFUD01016088.1~~GFUD01016088.1.p1  ORF type:complete len:725 (+),score=200.23 GFUD01016088.1:283-2457(+)